MDDDWREDPEYEYELSLRREVHRLRKENAALKARLEGPYDATGGIRRERGDNLAAREVGARLSVGQGQH